MFRQGRGVLRRWRGRPMSANRDLKFIIRSCMEKTVDRFYLPAVRQGVAWASGDAFHTEVKGQGSGPEPAFY